MSSMRRGLIWTIACCVIVLLLWRFYLQRLGLDDVCHIMPRGYDRELSRLL